MSGYKIIREDGEIVECDCCQTEAPLQKFETIYKKKELLCEVCSSTFISQRRHDPVDGQTLAQVVHLILKEIRNEKLK